MVRARLTAVIVAMVAVLGAVGPVAAEWRFDVFGGVSITQPGWLELDAEVVPLGNQRLRANEKVEARTSPNLGARATYWFDSPKWLGVALDVFHYRPDLPDQITPKFERARLLTGFEPIHIQVTAVAVDLMLRAPGVAPSQEFPEGQLEPYALIGPAGFITRLTDRGNLTPAGQSAVGLFPGFQVGGGLMWKFSKHLGLMTEYRFTRFSVDFDDQQFARNSFGGIPVSADGHINVLSHHVFLGLSFRY